MQNRSHERRQRSPSSRPREIINPIRVNEIKVVAKDYLRAFRHEPLHPADPERVAPHNRRIALG